MYTAQSSRFIGIFDSDAVVLSAVFPFLITCSACLLEPLLHFPFALVWHLGSDPAFVADSVTCLFQWELVCDFRELGVFENATQNYFGACMSLKRASIWLFSKLFSCYR